MRAPCSSMVRSDVGETIHSASSARVRRIERHIAKGPTCAYGDGSSGERSIHLEQRSALVEMTGERERPQVRCIARTFEDLYDIARSFARILVRELLR